MLLTPDRGNGPNMKCYSPRKEKKKSVWSSRCVAASGKLKNKRINR